jgi:large subunit ribosomal protein L13
VKTVTPNQTEALQSREWYVVDATGKTLGTSGFGDCDQVLRGKHKPTFSPNIDTGDFVVVVNCERVAVTGAKLDTVRYYRHSRYPGGSEEPHHARDDGAIPRSGHL